MVCVCSHAYMYTLIFFFFFGCTTQLKGSYIDSRNAQLNEATNMYNGAMGIIALYIALGGATR